MWYAPGMGMRKSNAARADAAAREPDPARAERRSALLRFFADPPRAVAEAALALRAADERYGDDTDAELADLEAGGHPLLRPKTSPSAG